MADTLIFELVSPERLLASAEVSSVVIPASEGEVTVMAHHAPMMTTLKAGMVKFRKPEGDVVQFLVFGGFADIQGENCTVLAESAVPVGEASNAIEKRIKQLRADLEHAQHEKKSAIEQLLGELTQLNKTVLPA
ncbi:F0F1 ATP synthase subunit epsilon [Martelella alba]|uniref:ATP synthase epsilon chain n=1 Tax=Martelella alba TaxID=2590451 RepID=A0A506UBQ5_9HYPH|nr:F0F1 ATP synthase subunit epsilon [Martelella alba]TPW30826.1 F0F1 ATP synthase subunit epsilon [Martelella alba]